MELVSAIKDLVSLEQGEIPEKPLTSEVAMVSSRGTRSLLGERMGGGVVSWVSMIQVLILSVFSAWETGRSMRPGRRISSVSRSISIVAFSG